MFPHFFLFKSNRVDEMNQTGITSRMLPSNTRLGTLLVPEKVCLGSAAAGRAQGVRAGGALRPGLQARCHLCGARRSAQALRPGWGGRVRARVVLA